MKKLSIAFGLSLLAVLILGEGRAVAQQVTAVITGQVTDPSGSPIIGASVQARDVDRGTTEKTTTNVDGIYNFPRLTVGNYEVRVEAKGFQTAVRPAFQLVLNQTARMDFAMKIGQVNETVEVTGAAPLLQTETTQLSTIIDSSTNENLPLASRNYVQLTLLAPGAVTVAPSGFVNGITTGFGPGGGDSSRPYINGNREQANNFLLDGIDNNQVSDNLVGYTPNSDAIQEFNMITQNASAEFGNFQGGIINATIKSGTNEFHGDAFEFFRNDKLNANYWENNWSDVPRSAMRWNQFGGTVGGPVKKNKIFFFADYQGFRYDIPTSVGVTTLFTTAERSGDFSALLTAPTAYRLTNPFNNGAPFTGNIIPLSLESPVMKNLFSSNLYPATMNNNLINNYYDGNATLTDQKQGDLKMDYNISDRDHLTGRYSRLYANDPSTTTFQLNSNAFVYDNAHTGVLNWTHTFSPTLVNEARGGVNYVLVENGYSPQSGVGDLGQTLGITNANVGGPGLISLSCSSCYVAGIGNSNSGAQQLFASTVIQFDDNVIITKGRHVIKTGFQFYRERIDIYYASNSGNLGNIGFDGQYSGSGESDWFLGLPYTFGKGGGLAGTWGQRANIIAGFVNDDFRVNDSLTLNLGLRYENHTPWEEVDNRQANFGLYSGTVYLAGQSCPFSNCRALYNSYNAGYDFQPRIGFAYAPKMFDHKTVIRGAYTTSTYLEGTGTNLRLPMNPPLATAETLVTYSTTQGPLPATNLSQGLILPPAGDPFAGASLRIWAPDMKPALVQQWSFTVQHQFSNSTTLQAGYVGQHGTHLVVPLQLSQGILNSNGTVSPTPYLSGNSTLYNDVLGNGGNFKDTAAIGNQRYDSLQVVLQKRLSSGLEGQVAYTYSKCMTDSSGYYGTWGPSVSGFGAATYWQNVYDQKSEWGPCFFDQKQTLTANAIYNVPYGKGRKYGANLNPALNAIAGDWNLSTIITARTGMPTTAYTWNNVSGTGSFWLTRANCVAPLTESLQPYAGGGLQLFNNYPTANSPGAFFQQPANYTFGNCGNSTIYGTGSGDLDVSLMKDFPIKEKMKLQLRGDFINFTNSKILNAPSAGLGAGMGTITSTQFPRLVQLALKFYF
jgi:hypothetical protein